MADFGTEPQKFLSRLNWPLFGPAAPLIRNKNSHSMFDIGFLKTNEIKLLSGATSLFDVQRWTFDVRCSSFKTTL
jgi:hypothetical protein